MNVALMKEDLNNEHKLKFFKGDSKKASKLKVSLLNHWIFTSELFINKEIDQPWRKQLWRRLTQVAKNWVFLLKKEKGCFEVKKILKFFLPQCCWQKQSWIGKGTAGKIFGRDKVPSFGLEISQQFVLSALFKKTS